MVILAMPFSSGNIAVDEHSLASWGFGFFGGDNGQVAKNKRCIIPREKLICWMCPHPGCQRLMKFIGSPY